MVYKLWNKIPCIIIGSFKSALLFSITEELFQKKMQLKNKYIFIERYFNLIFICNFVFVFYYWINSDSNNLEIQAKILRKKILSIHCGRYWELHFASQSIFSLSIVSFKIHSLTHRSKALSENIVTFLLYVLYCFSYFQFFFISK